MLGSVHEAMMEFMISALAALVHEPFKLRKEMSLELGIINMYY